MNLGIPDDVIAQGEQAIEDYASLNNITLPTSDKQESKPKKNLIENQVAQVPPPKQEGVGEQMDKLA